MSCQSLDTSRCQNGAQSRGEPLMRLAFIIRSGSEGVQSMGNEDSDAQNNEECSYSFKHRRILRNRFTKRSTFCTVKQTPLSRMKLPPA
jgi:hypothetical protein